MLVAKLVRIHNRFNITVAKELPMQQTAHRPIDRSTGLKAKKRSKLVLSDFHTIWHWCHCWNTDQPVGVFLRIVRDVTRQCLRVSAVSAVCYALLPLAKNTLHSPASLYTHKHSWHILRVSQTLLWRLLLEISLLLERWLVWCMRI